MTNLPMTWGEIFALDDDALNLAIETHCTTHQWHREYCSKSNAVVWVLWHPDYFGPQYSSLPHFFYTTSWDHCMALAWKYQLAIHPSSSKEYGYVCYDPTPSSTALFFPTEGEARKAVCQLALWQAVQQKKNEAP